MQIMPSPSADKTEFSAATTVVVEALEPTLEATFACCTKGGGGKGRMTTCTNTASKYRGAISHSHTAKVPQ